MPYKNTYGFPEYDPTKPMGGWDAETWKRYRKQQRDRSYPGQYDSSEREARSAKRAERKRKSTVAKIDATLARNTLGARPPDLPDLKNASTRGRRSGAQILYDRKVERRERLKARRDSAQRELDRSAGRATLGTPTTPNATTTGQSAYVNATTGVPIAGSTNPALIVRAKRETVLQPVSPTTSTAGALKGKNQPTSPTYTPGAQQRVVPLNAGEQAAVNAKVGELNAYAITNTGRSATTGKTTKAKAKLPAAGRSDWATEQRKKGTSAYVIQQQKGQVAAQAKRVAGYTPAAGKSKDQPAPSKATPKTLPVQSKAVDQDKEAQRAKEKQAQKLRSSKAWQKGRTPGAPQKGFNTGRGPMA